MKIPEFGGESQASLVNDPATGAALGSAPDFAPGFRVEEIPGDRILKAWPGSRVQCLCFQTCGKPGLTECFCEGGVDPVIPVPAGEAGRFGSGRDREKEGQVVPVFDFSPTRISSYRAGGGHFSRRREIAKGCRGLIPSIESGNRITGFSGVAKERFIQRHLHRDRA
jgi:hypothetical protein